MDRLKRIIVFLVLFLAFGFLIHPKIVDWLSCVPGPKINYTVIMYFSADGPNDNKIQDVSILRLNHVLKIYKSIENRENLYILVNGHGENPNTVYNAKTYLTKNGVLEENILLEVKSKNTWENIKFAFSIFDENNIKNVMLVSSPYHLPRILKYVEKQKLYLGRDISWSSYDHQKDNKRLFHKMLQIIHELLSVPRDYIFFDNELYSKACYS